ncbi:MAG TPA: DUF2283 domain-containing protein [Methanosarcinaceae archaeon]|nr:DUF2283 domain-containing protein [Methanosarcinaceae archaeon]
MVRSTKSNKFNYDFDNDVIFFYSENKNYDFSIDTEGIIFDLSDDKHLMDIEIFDASKRFGVSKSDLRTVKHFEANINIDRENIKISMKLGIQKRNRLLDKIYDALALNTMNIPPSKYGMAASC